MGQGSLIFIALIMISSLIPTRVGITQTTDEGADTLQNLPPPVLPPNFSSYIVVPQEDLNNFGMSTLRPSTLGTRTEEINNLKTNQLRERGEMMEEATEVIAPEESNVEFIPLPQKTRDRFYMWVDKDGIINITNDRDSVPSKYRGQVKTR